MTKLVRLTNISEQTTTCWNENMENWDKDRSGKLNIFQSDCVADDVGDRNNLEKNREPRCAIKNSCVLGIGE
jgi:hypothetical protein